MIELNRTTVECYLYLNFKAEAQHAQEGTRTTFFVFRLIFGWKRDASVLGMIFLDLP